MNVFEIIHLLIVSSPLVTFVMASYWYGPVTGGVAAILAFVVVRGAALLASVIDSRSVAPLCEECGATTHRYDAERKRWSVRCPCGRQGFLEDGKLFEISASGPPVLIASRNWLGCWRLVTDH